MSDPVLTQKIYQLWHEAQAAVQGTGGLHRPIERIIPAPAFFPGGLGCSTREGLTEAPLEGRVMFVGQDFGTVKYAEGVYATGEVKNVTWSALRGILKTGDLDAADCFFTNALLGLRANRKMTGLAPGWRDPVLVVHSRELLFRQIELIQPSAIFALGLPAARFIGSMAQSLSSWASAQTWAHLDAIHPIRHVVPEFSAEGRPVAVGALIHPSLRGPNLRHRTFRGEVRGRAEERIIAEVCKRWVGNTHTRIIPSHLLHPADIPGQRATWEELSAFGYTFEGYEYAGGADQLMAWTEANVPPTSVDMARAMLYGHLRWMRSADCSWEDWHRKRDFLALLGYVREGVERARKS